MVIGWYIVSYERMSVTHIPARHCAMNNHSAAILADGGTWSAVEILGNRAIVKVRASASTLQTRQMGELA